MLCAISGEAPQVPVASRKSGTVFERRLIESYISQNHKDPVTGEDLEVEDLVDLKTSRVVKPRPPTLTSIPALLSVFQNEWDALALETFTLKQYLAQLRQELSTALYNNDAAVRVITRLTKERDEARDALSKYSLSERRNGAGATADGGAEAMEVDELAMSEELQAKVDATQERLSKTRRKRPVPTGWATPDSLSALDFTAPAKPLDAASRALALDNSGKTAIVGGADGSSCVYSIADRETLQSAQGDGSEITDVVAWEHDGQISPVIGTSAGEIAVLENGVKKAQFKQHIGSVTALALHPSGEILASVGTDKRVVLYDLSNSQVVSQAFVDSELTCCHFHPDGHLLATGTRNGSIKLFHTKSLEEAATFVASGPLASLSFSENGIWLASAVRGSSTVSVWDLRKGNELAYLDFGSKIDCVRWDYTGQYLAGAGPGSVGVQAYDKSAKSWSEPLRKAVQAVSVAWGPMAGSLVVLTADGALSVLQ